MRHLVDLAVGRSIIVVRPPEMNALQELQHLAFRGIKKGATVRA